MHNTLRGHAPDQIPVAPHWWGEYKVELAAGRLSQMAAASPERLAETDALFYDTFRPDWFHLGAGAWGGTVDGDRERAIAEICPHVSELRSDRDIDEYIELCRVSAQDVRDSGVYDHVALLSERYGDEAYIAMNEGNPVCAVFDPHGVPGFEKGLMALVEQPRRMARLIDGLYERRLDSLGVLVENGCDAYVGSETYVGADLISPQSFAQVVFPALRDFYASVRRMGLDPIIYFCGDIVPVLPFINELEVTALMIEESKKNFHLDPIRIRRELADHITLFGNLDSVSVLRFGSVADVETEARAQMAAARYGRFVVANGSPIAPGTPKENVEAMIRVARDPPGL